MSDIRIAGWGAVSPAGWSMAALRDAMAKGDFLEPSQLARPGGMEAQVLRVPPANPRPAFLAHARLRRSSPVTQYTVAAALQALGPDPGDTSNLGVVVCVFSGCVSYSRRFYDETLRHPATASPLVFPETVFNAPASHLSAFLGSTAINYTMVGDAGTYLLGLALAAQWLQERRVSRCLLVGTEEVDWLTADALGIFARNLPPSEGAGALLLERRESAAGTVAGEVFVDAITDELQYDEAGKMDALSLMRRQLGAASDRTVLCDSVANEKSISRPEANLWADWGGSRFSPKRLMGEGLMAVPAWQCALGADALKNGAGETAFISVAGLHQHAIGARFVLRQ